MYQNPFSAGLEPIPEKVRAIAGPGKAQVSVVKMVGLKPQITKEYINSQAIGKPDYEILN
jgi:hypothetical protein|tara:strand:+ start:316 stop:495 length:180 start_codon:yes stop_codon:yes gene_type:complete